MSGDSKATFIEGGPIPEGGYILKVVMDDNRSTYLWFQSKYEMEAVADEMFPHLMEVPWKEWEEC